MCVEETTGTQSASRSSASCKIVCFNCTHPSANAQFSSEYISCLRGICLHSDTNCDIMIGTAQNNRCERNVWLTKVQATIGIDMHSLLGLNQARLSTRCHLQLLVTVRLAALVKPLADIKTNPALPTATAARQHTRSATWAQTRANMVRFHAHVLALHVLMNDLLAASRYDMYNAIASLYNTYRVRIITSDLGPC